MCICFALNLVFYFVLEYNFYIFDASLKSIKCILLHIKHKELMYLYQYTLCNFLCFNIDYNVFLLPEAYAIHFFIGLFQFSLIKMYIVCFHYPPPSICTILEGTITFNHISFGVEVMMIQWQTNHFMSWMVLS